MKEERKEIERKFLIKIVHLSSHPQYNKIFSHECSHVCFRPGPLTYPDRYKGEHETRSFNIST